MKLEFLKHLGRIHGESRGALKGNTSSKRDYVQHVGRINEGFKGYQMGIFVVSVKNMWRIKVL